MKNTPLTEDHLFRKAYAKGKSAAGKYAVVYVLKDTANGRIRRADPLHRPFNRLGLTVGKKIGGAVERSRARRLLREAYRQISKEAGDRLSHGFLLVIAARIRITEAKEQEVQADLRRTFEKVGLLKQTAKKNPEPAKTAAAGENKPG